MVVEVRNKQLSWMCSVWTTDKAVEDLLHVYIIQIKASQNAWIPPGTKNTKAKIKAFFNP